jgi:hypothetical protein
MGAEQGTPAVRAGWAKIAVGVVLTIALLVPVGMLFRWGATDNYVAAESPRFLVVLPEQVSDPQIVAAAKDVIWRSPLEPAALNILYAVAARRDRAAAAPQRQLLGQLGWRNTAAQQNLIDAAARDSDLVSVLDRVEGLMRREKLTKNLDPFLMALEQYPPTQTMLVERLIPNDRMRNNFLIRSGLLQSSNALTARAATMNALIDRGVRINRYELTPVIGALLGHNQGPIAYALWSHSIGRKPSAELIYDPGFRLTQRTDIRRDVSLPFEWQFAHGLGYSSTLDANNALAIRWSGEGVPQFVSQTISIPADVRGVLLRVIPITGSEAAVSQQLQFSLHCASSVADLRLIKQTDQGIFFAGLRPNCPVPTLTVSGKVQDVEGSVRAKIRAISMTGVALPSNGGGRGGAGAAQD